MRQLILLALLGACGDNIIPAKPPDAQPADGPTPDGPSDACLANGGAACFALPNNVLLAHEGNQTQQPDNSCTRNPQTSNSVITLAGNTVDSTGQGIGPSTVAITYAAGFGTPDVSTTTDIVGDYLLTLPMPVPNSFDVLITRSGAYDVRFENAQIFFNPVAITGRLFPTIGRTEWSTALTGIDETPVAAEGAVLATATDCDDRTLEFATVTLSSTSSRADSAAPTFIPGTRVFYLDGATPTPVKRDARTQTGASGGFVILGVDPGTYFLQSWGFADATALGMGMAGLTIVGERQITVVADKLSSTQLTPRSGP